MEINRTTTVAFTGHRSYGGRGGEATDALVAVIEGLYARGFRTFLSGMAVGFDLAAAEAVIACRASMPELQLIAVVPFRAQEGRFSSRDRVRFDRILNDADAVEILSEVYYAGCYAVRNDFLVAHASLLVAWYDGSVGGTCYTVQRAQRVGLELINLHPAAPAVSPKEPTLF
ncbi:MAG: SLOG family protein [Alistipes sp.]